MTQIFSLSSPTDFTDFYRYWTCADWDFANLIIRNIGPIKNVDIELKKVNVFNGEQSSLLEFTILMILKQTDYLWKKS